QLPASGTRSVVQRGKVIGVTDHERRQVDFMCLVIVLGLLTMPCVTLCGLRWHSQCRQRQRRPESCQVATEKQQPTYTETGDSPGPETFPQCGAAHRILLRG